LLSGTYTITVSLAGYVTGTITGVTVAATGANVTVAALTLQRLYTITYDPNGGSGTVGPQSVVAGPINLLAGTGMTAPAGSGRTFGGWTINGSTTYAAGASYTVSADVTFKAIWAGVTSVGAIVNHITQSGGGIESNPVPLPVDVTFNTMSEWETLLQRIKDANKYVALDLTGSTMTGMMENGEFTPGKYNTGEKYVISLTLPEGVTKLKAGGSYGDSTFQCFVNLQEISGPKVEIVGAEMFYDTCRKLRSVSFPVATTIGQSAFGYCNELSWVYLPMATTFGAVVFRGNSTQPITLTLGTIAPTFGVRPFEEVTVSKPVTVRVPSGATGYNLTWENTLKDSSSINLTITTY
jgi:hypothetical protein